MVNQQSNVVRFINQLFPGFRGSCDVVLQSNGRTARFIRDHKPVHDEIPGVKYVERNLKKCFFECIDTWESEINQSQEESKEQSKIMECAMIMYLEGNVAAFIRKHLNHWKGPCNVSMGINASTRVSKLLVSVDESVVFVPDDNPVVNMQDDGTRISERLLAKNVSNICDSVAVSVLKANLDTLRQENERLLKANERLLQMKVKQPTPNSVPESAVKVCKFTRNRQKRIQSDMRSNRIDKLKSVHSKKTIGKKQRKEIAQKCPFPKCNWESISCLDQALNAHLSKRHAGYAFFCADCSRFFTNPNALQRHNERGTCIRRKSSVRQFGNCVECFRTSSNSDELQRHKEGGKSDNNSNQIAENIPSTSTLLHNCAECNHSFISKTFFEEHKKIQHSGNDLLVDKGLTAKWLKVIDGPQQGEGHP